jgi:hypothetical protein
MAGVTGIEPVTPTMSTKGNDVSHVFPILPLSLYAINMASEIVLVRLPIVTDSYP